MDDAALLGRACRGDENAFCELFARYQRRIYQYAMRMCGCAAGDDVVQETFLAVLKTGSRYDAAKGTVAAYLFGIARRQVFKRLAAQGAALTEPVHAADALPSAGGDSPFEAMDRQRTIAAVRHAIEELPAIYREVVVLCELQEMKYATVADIIECPIGTVRSRLHRARAQLLAKLAATGQVAVKRG